MRVIVINPWDQTVTEAEHNGDYRDYYRLLSGPTEEGHNGDRVTCFDIAHLENPAGHLLFVDDNGLGNAHQAYFRLDGVTYAGRGVIAASNGGEDESGATCTVDEVRALVRFLPIGEPVDPPIVVVTTFVSLDDIDRAFGS